MSQKGTARIGWTKIAANGVALTNFTSPNVVADLQTLNGTPYVATEVAGGTNYLIVDFTGVTAFNWVRLLATYQGNSTHNVAVQIEIAPFDGSAWDTLNTCDHHTSAGMEDYSFFIPDDSIYINGGVVNIKFNHSVSTVANHTLEIDECSLYQ